MVSLIKNESRQHTRRAPQNDLVATLTIAGIAYPARISDYSLSGVKVRVDKKAGHRAERKKFDISLSLQDTTYIGDVRYLRLEQSEAILGMNLRMPTHEELTSFTSEDPGWDLIEDADTNSNIFSDLVYKGAEAPMEGIQLRGGAGTLIPLSLKDENILIADIFEMRKSAFEPGHISLRFELFQTCHAFDGNIRKIEKNDRNSRIEIEFPQKVARLLRRETFRVKNGENGIQLKVKLRSRILGVSPADIEIFDFSEHGISVIDSSGWAHAPTGVPFDSIEISTNNNKTIRGTGSLRGHRWLPEKGAYAIGIMFESATDEDSNIWHNTILAARYPTLSFVYENSQHNSIWDLFDRSGYLDLKARESFSHMIDLTKHTWERLADAGTKISKRAQIIENGRTVGHLQMDRIYPDTWCAHHLAIDPKVSKVIAKELFAVATDVLSAEGAKYFISITEATKQWNQRAYYDFVKTYRFPDHQELRQYHLFQSIGERVILPSTSSELEVRIANKWDLRRISRFFEVYSTALERSALALNSEDLDLNQLNNEYANHDLMRCREFIVAMQGGRLVAFAQVERSKSGVNIFSLFDMVYIHFIPGETCDTQEVYKALLHAAQERFISTGISTFLFLSNSDEKTFFSSLGLDFISISARWISKCEASKRYQAYTNNLFGHLLVQRDRIRSTKKS